MGWGCIGVGMVATQAFLPYFACFLACCFPVWDNSRGSSGLLGLVSTKAMIPGTDSHSFLLVVLQLSQQLLFPSFSWAWMARHRERFPEGWTGFGLDCKLLSAFFLLVFLIRSFATTLYFSIHLLFLRFSAEPVLADHNLATRSINL